MPRGRWSAAARSTTWGSRSIRAQIRSAAAAARWSFECTERFGNERVVVFRDVSEGRASPELDATAAFLFDARGNLLEIDVQS